MTMIYARARVRQSETEYLLDIKVLETPDAHMEAVGTYDECGNLISIEMNGVHIAPHDFMAAMRLIGHADQVGWTDPLDAHTLYKLEDAARASEADGYMRWIEDTDISRDAAE